MLGPPGRSSPQSSPELQRLFFDVVTRSADPTAANGSPLVYQWRFTDADPWHLIDRQRLDPGRAGRSAEPHRHLRGQLGRLGRVEQARREPVEDRCCAAASARAARSARWLRMRKVFPGSTARGGAQRRVRRAAAVRPGPLGLELGGEREQRRLVAGAADDLDRRAACRRRRSRTGPPSPGCRGGSRGRSRDRSGSSRGPCGSRPALPAAHRQRRAAHHRRDQHVVGVEDRVDAGRVGLAAAHRPLEERVGEQRARAGRSRGCGVRAAPGAAPASTSSATPRRKRGVMLLPIPPQSGSRCATSWPSEPQQLGGLGDGALDVLGDRRRRRGARRRGRPGDPQLAGRGLRRLDEGPLGRRRRLGSREPPETMSSQSAVSSTVRLTQP